MIDSTHYVQFGIFLFLFVKRSVEKLNINGVLALYGNLGILLVLLWLEPERMETMKKMQPQGENMCIYRTTKHVIMRILLCIKD